MLFEIAPRPPLASLQPAPRPLSSLPPGLWAALGLIALYFALQALASTTIALLIGALTGFVHLRQGVSQVNAEVQALLQQPGMPAVMVMLTLGIAASLVLWLAYRRWPGLWSQAAPPGFGFVAPARPLFFALAVGVGLTAPVLGSWLTELLAHGHRVTQDIQQLGAGTPRALRIPLVLIVVSLGPWVEELLFRGVLLSALLQRWRTGWAVLLSSLVFALVHLPGLQFHWYALPDLLLLALMLAWLRLRSGSIWPAVLAHGVNNLLAVAAWFVAASVAG